jgi:TolB protein
MTLRHEPREASARSTEVRLGIKRSGLARDPIQMRVDDWTTSGDLAAAQGAATAGRPVLDNDLTISGLFALQAGARVSDSASATAMMGVELAVDVRAAGNQYDLHAQLFSLPQRSLISEKTYHASDAILRRVTHQISDDVVFQLSGETGIAQSQIAFSNQAGAAREIYVADYDGFGAHAVTRDRNLDFSPALSADGRWLVYSSLRRQTYAIMLMELATGKERVLFEGAGSALSPSFSPDGERVAFATSRDGNHEIYVVRTDGTGLTRLTRSSAIDVQPTWSPDGRQIAFCSDRSGVAQIHVMSSDGTDVRRLSQGRTRAEAPAWSPKGTLVAYMARVNGTYDTHAVDASTGNDFNLTQGKGSDESPHWAANGRHLLVVAHRGGETGLYILNSESGETFRLPIRGDVETPAWYR